MKEIIYLYKRIKKKQPIPTYKAFMYLNMLYVQFLKEPKKRQRTLTRIEKMTGIVCSDEKVLSTVKKHAMDKLAQLREMINECD